MSDTVLLQVQDLSVDFKTPDGPFHAVKGVSFTLKKGETLALVGESGSGKSVSALSIMQLLPYPLASHGPKSSVLFNGEELIGAPERQMKTLRGQQIGMIFQEPQSALNPLHTIEKQIGEVLMLHQNMDRAAAKARILELLDLVQLPMMKDRLDAYPHQLSGGQRQRVMIAMALANNPDLLIADEPTTALDVTVQAEILALLDSLKTKLDMALLLITHDLTIVQKMADTVCVMQHGQIVEHGQTKAVFNAPQHAYTKKLINAQPKAQPPKIAAAQTETVMDARNIKIHFPLHKNFWGKATSWFKAVDDVSLTIKSGQTLGVVGESGSGKTTLGLGLLKLLKAEGAIMLSGRPIHGLSGRDLRPLREDMQMVFQDPYGSLSPRLSVGQIIGEGLTIHRKSLSKAEREDLIVEALKNVHMAPETRHRYPHEFSGGQRQRISIARALVLNPKFIVLDEPTSALDLSVQAEIVDLLRDLQTRYTMAYMFISHDLRVVRAMAHYILVMKGGKVVESGPAANVFDTPQQDYTKNLLRAALDLRVRS